MSPEPCGFVSEQEWVPHIYGDAMRSGAPALVGVAPLDYLLRWRMRLAAHPLRKGDVSVSSVAASVGYESESAFSNTFKRVIGCVPRHYRHRTTRPSNLRALVVSQPDMF